MATRGTKVFRSVDELEARIEAYFKGLEYEKTETAIRNGQRITVTTEAMRPPTLSGLALVLEVSRRTLLNYSRKDEFSHVIARARSRIEEWHEEALYSRQTYCAARFMLAVNLGYRKSPGSENDAVRVRTVETTLVQPRRSEGSARKWRG
ncbi:hypothetical protein EF888_19885 [Silicimonas algicola]|uniref:terminase small subunit n=1 Tax=Silicimonas algicola TaxID=1826607 RepID=UPI000D6B6439|nr:terminase small subunit [Silicimonas algicola]AZQ69193.1 hypothetical protein EF888_19885 [Silicimonas algicola]